MRENLHIVCHKCNSINNVPSDKLRNKPKCGSCKAHLFIYKSIELNSSSFDRHINNSSIPVVVDFWASWCGPCKMMSPIFEQAAEQLETTVRLARVSTEREQGLAMRFDIKSIPTLIIFSNGREVARRPGANDLSGLLAWIKSVAM